MLLLPAGSILRALAVGAVLCGLAVRALALPAFPGAEGAGGNAVGGRNGDVYHVTNTNPSGAGSLAYGLTTGVPAAGRTIVFDVSGYAHISGTLRVTASKITIAGQTAPGDGFGLKDGTFLVSGDDIVIRHLRFRDGNSADSINLDSGSLNSIFDHCDALFSNDENMSSFQSAPENMTFQWSLNAWGMESHSCGGLWDQNHATCHHSLWAHNHTRNPKGRTLLLDWVNNVTFDWDIGFILGDSTTPANWNTNVIGNYFIGGTSKSTALEKGARDRNGAWNFHVYINPNTATSAPFHNFFDGDANHVLDQNTMGWNRVSGDVEHLTAPLVNAGIPVTQDPPLTAYKKVVSAAGPLRLDVDAGKPLRDEVAALLITELVAQTHHHISSVANLTANGVSNGGFGTLSSTPAPLDTDKDGMPDVYEDALGWSKATDDHTTPLPSSGGFITGTTFFPPATAAGYTRLEEYLHFLAIPHGTVAKRTATDGSAADTFLDVDLRKFTSGFSGAPVFTVVAGTSAGGTAAMRPDGFTARFVPTQGTAGRGKFDFKVVDGATNWTQTCAVLISNAGVPRELRWKGAILGNPNIWDTSKPYWLKDADDPTLPGNLFFSSGDSALFDDNGSNATDIALTGALTPGAVAVNAVKNYVFSGTGTLGGAMPLTKSGTGTLTIGNTGASTFSGGTTLNEGTITLASTTANASGLGAGKITLAGGTLNMFDNGPGVNNSTTLPNDLEIIGTATLNTTQRGGLGGDATGAGTLNLFVPYVRLDLNGNWSAFAGTINVTSGSGGGDFRINNNATSWPLAHVNLGEKVSMYYVSTGVVGGLVVPVGEIDAPATASLRGGPTGGRPTTFAIGGLNGDSAFLGAIGEQNGSTVNLTKNGTGTLTLGGPCTYTGATLVNAGTLIVSGTLGNTAVTLAGGTSLIGGGSIGSTTGGAVVANATAMISPGTAPFTGATLTLGNGLALNGNTLYFDMSNSPAGANDKIVLRGGALALGGSQYFQFLLLQGTLGAGIYDLITGAASTTGTATFTHNLPMGTRQAFDLALVGTVVRLTVTGDPATLTWTGATSANWDSGTLNNWTGATPNTFGYNDAVIIDDSSAVTSIAIPAPVSPRSTLVNNTTRAFTLAGGLNGGALTKSGTNTLTFTGANTFGGGLTLNAGTIVLANDAANAGALGTGPVTMYGGVISMHDDAVSYNNFYANLVVPAGATASLNADSRVDMYGTLSGAGTLNFYIPFTRTTLFTDWSAFTGIINVLTDAGGGDFRMGTAYGFPGFPHAAVVLPDHVWAYYTGTLAQGAGTTIEIGELSGTALTVLEGGATGGRALTYRIGGRNTDAAFAGTIQEQNTGTATAYVKTGTGTWTLGGTGAWNGGTTVEQGTLKITGSVTCGAATSVASLAALNLAGGSLTTDALDIASGATFSASGTATLTGDFNNDGTATIASGVFACTGDVVNNGTMRFNSGAALAATGAFVNNGLLDLLTSPSALPANFENNGIVLIRELVKVASVAKNGSTFTVTIASFSAHTYQLLRADTLAGSWSPVGTPQNGAHTVNGDGSITPALLTFTDIGGATGAQRYYRVSVGP